MVEARARGLRVEEGGSSVHPDGSRLQCVEKPRRAERHVAVLVLTISLDADDHCRPLALDADSVLSKAALGDIADARRQLRLISDPESVVSEKRSQPASRRMCDAPISPRHA
jgi:hypothetical protein